MLAHKLQDNLKKIKYPCQSQEKLDGCRGILFKDETGIHITSRNGLEYPGPLDDIKKEALANQGS